MVECRICKGFTLDNAKIRQRATNYSRQPGPKTPVKCPFLTKKPAKTKKTPVRVPVLPKIRRVNRTPNPRKAVPYPPRNRGFQTVLFCFAVLFECFIAVTNHTGDGSTKRANKSPNVKESTIAINTFDYRNKHGKKKRTHTKLKDTRVRLIVGSSLIPVASEKGRF